MDRGLEVGVDGEVAGVKEVGELVVRVGVIEEGGLEVGVGEEMERKVRVEVGGG